MGITPQQGVPFADPDDPPCDLAGVIEKMAELADLRGKQYDAAGAAVKSPVFVMVSATNIQPRAQFAGGNGQTHFTNVDVNHGTPTDLTIFDRGLMLNPGVYLHGMRILYAGRGTAAYLHEARFGGYFLGSQFVPNMVLRNRDAGTTLPVLPGGLVGWPAQGNCGVGILLVQNPAQQVTATTDNYPEVISYVNLWAVKIGEL